MNTGTQTPGSAKTSDKGERMKRNKPSLPSDRAFVIQLRWDAAVEDGDFQGRVEHLTSMRATHFHSLEELAAFLTQVVSSLQADKAETEEE